MISFQRSAWFTIAIAVCSIQTGCGGEQEPAKTAEATPPPPAAPKAEEAPAAPAPTPGELIAKWYGDCWDMFSDKKWDEFSKCYSDDATATVGSMPMVLTGRSQIVEQRGKVLATAFPDVRGERQITLQSGNHVASIALIYGTQTGPLKTPDGNTIAPTNKKIGLLMLHTVDVNPAGQAVTQWEVSNTPTMLAQLGLSKDPVRPLLMPGTTEPVVVIAKGDATEAQNIESHKKAYEFFNKHDAAMADLFADAIVVHDPTMPSDVTGKAENIALLQEYWKAFSDLKGELDTVWGAGDYTAAFGHMTGTNNGDMPSIGLKKTGKKVDMRFGEMIQWENGKAKAVYPFMDSMDMAVQLGMLDHAKKPAAGKAATAKPTATAKPAATKPAATATKPAATKPAPSKAPATTGAKPTGKK